MGTELLPEEDVPGKEAMPIVYICEKGGRGMVLPLFENEHSWPKPVRGIFYFLLLVWCFLGVSIIADIFMTAIEAVTSRRTRTRSHDGRMVTGYLWNDTVANLTLMALGSSAPEIFLSVVELLGKGMHAGDLGPATIVGSAAFNLLVIVAVCIVCIPPGESRLIAELPVFYITSVFSLVAYFWLWFVLAVTSPDIVEIWEAVLTLLFLPLLVWLSYRVDVGGWWNIIPSRCLRARGEGKDLEDGGRDGLTPTAADAALADSYGNRLSSSGLTITPRRSRVGSKDSIETEDMAMRSRWSKPRRSIAAFHNSAMLRISQQCNHHHMWLPGGYSNNSSVVGSRASTQHSMNTCCCRDDGAEASAVFQFIVDRQCWSPSLRHKAVMVTRSGELSTPATIAYTVFIPEGGLVLDAMPTHTIEEEEPDNLLLNSSSAGLQVVERGMLEFSAGDTDAEILLQRPTTDIIVSLEPTVSGAVGAISSTYTEVAKESHAGVLCFARDERVIFGRRDEQNCEVVVLRRKGCIGEVSCTYSTEALSAVPGYDFSEMEGELVFPEGVTEQRLLLHLPGKSPRRRMCEFMIVLRDAQGGAEFDPTDDGGDNAALLSITITALPEGDRTWCRRLDSYVSVEGLKRGRDDWLEQVEAALYVNGSREEQADATPADWAFHVVSVPWRLLFSTVPPTAFCGGWLCFFLSLAWVAVVTAVVADLAELFGCVLSVPDTVTAVSFVALGTSMPDLFASKVAATEDETADASIVNVTGSNSVNVFLGLGLPWTMAACYWQLGFGDNEDWALRYGDIGDRPGMAGKQVFVFYRGSLSFCVLAFGTVCIAALALLVLRRRCVGAELGGPAPQRLSSACAFVMFWVVYVGAVSFWSVRAEERTAADETALTLIGLGIVVLAGSWPVVSLLRYKRPPETDEQSDEAKPEPEAAQAQMQANLAAAGAFVRSSGVKVNGDGSTRQPAEEPARCKCRSVSRSSEEDNGPRKPCFSDATTTATLDIGTKARGMEEIRPLQATALGPQAGDSQGLQTAAGDVQDDPLPPDWPSPLHAQEVAFGEPPEKAAQQIQVVQDWEVDSGIARSGQLGLPENALPSEWTDHSIMMGGVPCCAFVGSCSPKKVARPQKMRL
eukprot:TRINITY_DN13475_c0_g1_i1.p1 TRINITY_DN13475_c0_g1~~TRINITY_DN13475_c0_g1_i1.p1  ORF type:complete len:1170 (+),score=226.04 TRINITY_DN13475_c0_g1_i1:142-3510(+)